ncbi:MAG: hypothetical protein ACOX2F_09355 [bacterium]
MLLALSAYCLAECRREGCHLEDFDDYVAKPVDYRYLIELIKKYTH